MVRDLLINKGSRGETRGERDFKNFKGQKYLCKENKEWYILARGRHKESSPSLVRHSILICTLGIVTSINRKRTIMLFSVKSYETPSEPLQKMF